MMSLIGLLPSPPAEVTGGSVLFGGEDLLKADAERLRCIRGGRIGFVFQDPMTSLNPVLTIGHQLAEAVEAHQPSLRARQVRARVQELLEMVAIPNAAERITAYPHELSGGMRQRVMIAIALACRPRLLIADEPTTALDVTIQGQVLDLIRRLQSELRMAVLFITHDLGVVAQMADRVAVMYAGRIVEEAPVEAFFESPAHPNPDPRRPAQALQPIRGTVPSLDQVPPGCAFQPRCDRADGEDCARRRPGLEPYGERRAVRCWRPHPVLTGAGS
jgi:peptide/nickel transport system ATP-binding protein/oligopeptide transport system ATP-binding protein